MTPSKDLPTERMNTCRSCPYLDRSKISSVFDRCKACRCFVEIKTKVPSSTCPKGKWIR